MTQATLDVLDDERVVIEACSAGAEARIEIDDDVALELADRLTIVVERRRRARLAA